MPIVRPAADEYVPFYETYVSQVTEPDLVALLTAQQTNTARFLAGLTETQAACRYAPDKWSIREIIGHLADSERIFSYRLLRIARADTTPLPGFDENAYVPSGEFERRPLASVAAEFASVRAATLTLLQGLTPEGLARMGTASGKPISARALAYIIGGHEKHHLGVVRERYLK
jgi:DinB family protein